MPFESETFHRVWTEHAQMKFADKTGFYSEIARVLRPGGHLAFRDIFRGPSGDVYYPVPWAADPLISSLAPVGATEWALKTAGVRSRFSEEVTHNSLAYFRSAFLNTGSEISMLLGLNQLMGADARVKMRNMGGKCKTRVFRRCPTGGEGEAGW